MNLDKMQSSNDVPRQDKCWRILREGEVSPYKIVTVIFIRESYIHVELRRGSPDERCATVRLIHDLITCHDMTFPELKSVLEDPRNRVRMEILKRFNKVLQNLEEVNASFLYELVNSVIDVESTQTNILRKRITKSSPFGKYLRIILLNLRKMSYPQALCLYQQLCAYLQPTIEFKKPCWVTRPLVTLEIPKIKTELPIVIKKEVDEFQENIPTPSTSSAKLETTPSPRVLASSTPSSSSKAAKVDKRRRKGLDMFVHLTQGRKKSSLLGLSMSLSSQFSYERKKYLGLLTIEDDEIFTEQARLKKERVSKALEKGKSLRALWNPESSAGAKKEEIIDTSPETSFQPKRQRQRSTPKKGVKSPRKVKYLPTEISVLVDDDSDYFLSETESQEKEVIATPVKRGTRSASIAAASPAAIKSLKSSEKEKKSTELKRKISPSEPSVTRVKPKESDNEMTLASKLWPHVKYWSRKQIEKTIKVLASDLYHARGRQYLPSEISAFVEAIKYNPSAQVLHPQLHYLEYLNCLRLKDLSRCTESLRTSFDLRIKPNTSELNKGTPYAAYNFAVFYHLMGFRQDALLYLEEAFQAGHSAADATCLHYCHNLWSAFHEKPYTDAIVTVTKEVDRHMAYLHSLNVISNAYDYQFQGLPPEEIIYALWHYNACDIEEIESVLLLSLGSFFSMFGWHDLVAFTCQSILYSKLRWPTHVFCGALCLLSQNILMEGDTELAVAMMEYGDRLFGFESSAAGQLFGRQYGLFEALYAYLGRRPVADKIIERIAAYDEAEQLFWRAYNGMIHNDFEEAEKLLKRLIEKDVGKSCDKRELKLRCIHLQAELRCLSGKPTTALKHLFEALELAHKLFSDHYVTLCLLDIASIQCELGLVKTASRTLYQELRASSRSSSPILTAKSNLVTVKLRLTSSTPISPNNHKHYLALLDESKEIFERWDNSYRMEQVAFLKSKLQALSSSSEGMDVDECPECSALHHTTFTPSTCIL